MKAGDVSDPRLSFDDILEAVQDSRRGRWFLDEFRNRMRQEDQARILSAINKIENRLETLPGTSAATGELDKVRAAIAATRSDIARLGLKPQGLSEEGRLFANLAELARKTLPAEANENVVPGVLRALRLVDSLDATLNPPQAVAPVPTSPDSFFAQDAALFDAPATPPAIAASIAAPVAAVETSAPAPVVAAPPPAPVPQVADLPASSAPQGARFVIVKTGADEHPDEPALCDKDLPAEPERAEAADVAIPTAPEPDAMAYSTPRGEPEDMRSDTPRIVIIRRKPEEMAELPLAEFDDMTGAAGTAA